MIRYVNKTKNTVLAERVRYAKTFMTRLKGLLGTSALSDGDGLLISPCSSIHMFGMKYSIDCVFLDKHNTVVGLVENIQPGKMSKTFSNATQCLELPAGKIARTGTAVGNALTVENTTSGV